MKSTLKYFSIFLLSILIYVGNASASPLATFNYKVFYTPDQKPFIETYFDISGQSIVLTETDEGFLQGKVELTLIFRQGENIVTFDKKVLESPEMSAGNIVDFIDVQRFVIPHGKYTLEVNLRDVLDPNGLIQTNEIPIEIPAGKEGVFFSDISLVSAFKKAETPGLFTKAGYDLLPMVSDDYLNPAMDEIVVYGEMYTDQPGKPVLIKTFLERADDNQVVESTMKYLKRESAEVTPVLTRIPIADVKTGDYRIVIEAVSPENEVLARQTSPVARTHRGEDTDPNAVSQEELASSWVQRYDNKGVLHEHFKSLRPIAGDKDIYAMDYTFSDIEKVDLPYLQRFFYAFWENRNPEDSEGAWLAYQTEVEIADQKFGTKNKKGYETDRGRVYLRYGKPNDITDRANEPSSYPYQIWRYYKADRFNNVRFVFYDPTLMAMDYELLHVEYIPGEIRNPQWKVLLEQRNTPMDNVDRREGQEHFGGRIDDFYNNPR